MNNREINYENRAEAELAMCGEHPSQKREQYLRDNPRSMEALREQERRNRIPGWYDANEPPPRKY